MKSIIRQLSFYLKQALFALVLISIFIFTVLYAQSNPNINLWIIISFAIVVIAFLTYLYFVIGWNFKKPFCKIPITAKLIGDTTIYQRSDEVSYGVYRRSLLTLEYKYKNKIYKKSIVCNSKPRKDNSKINIKVCKNFPKIIYIP